MKRTSLLLAALLLAVSAASAGSVAIMSGDFILPEASGAFGTVKAAAAGAGSAITYEIHSVDPVANAAYVGADSATVLAAYADGQIVGDGVYTKTGTATAGYFQVFIDGVYGNGVDVAFLVVVRYEPGGGGGAYAMACVVAKTTDSLGYGDTVIALFLPTANPPVCLVKPEWSWTVVTRPSFAGEPGSGAAPGGGLSKFDAAAEYDGLGHAFDTNALAEALAATDAGAYGVEYALDAGGSADAATWSAVPHLFTNVGEHTAWYRVTSPYYEDFVHAARVTITNTTIVYEARNGGGKYSGGDFGIEVRVSKPPSGAVVKYAASASGPWQDEPVTFRDACEAAAVHFRIEVAGHEPVVGWRTVSIAKRAVTLASGGATKTYDGTPLRNDADPAVGGDGFAPGEGASFVFSGSQTEVGSSANAFTYALAAGTEAGNYEIATVFGTLTVTKAAFPVAGEPGGGAVPAGGRSKFDATALYDGCGHTLDTNALVAAFAGTMVGGCEVAYAVGAAGADPARLSWAPSPPLFADAGEYGVWYRVSNPNHEVFAHAAMVTVAKRAVTLASRSATKVYDGTPLRSAADPAVGGDGFAPGEGAAFSFSGSQTEVGSSANAFAYQLNTGTKAGNYAITTVFGTLTVTKAAAPVARTYKVKFYACGGKGSMSAATFTYGKAKKLSKNKFSRKGYVFAGWAKSKAKAKAGKVAYANRQKVKNLTTTGKTAKLYAIWAKKTYKVKFYACGGKGSMSAVTFTYGKAKKLPKSTFKRKGCKFAGWARSRALAESDTVAFKNGKAVKNLTKKGGTVRLYAVWKRK